MDQLLIPVGVTYSQVIEDFRAILRHELQTHTPAPLTAGATDSERKPQTARQLATTYDVCVATIWEWCRQGKFASHKIGGRTYFYTDEVAAALETKQRTVKTGRAVVRRG